MTAAMAIVSLPRTVNTAYRDRLDVFLDLSNSPLAYLFPLIATLLAVGPVYTRLKERFLYLQNIRGGITRATIGMFGSAAIIAASFGASFVLWPAMIAFLVWPRLGDPNLFPEDYGLQGGAILQDALGRTSYSQLLQYGEAVYILSYAAIVALSAVAFAVIAVACMLSTTHLAGAVLLPWLGFLAWTIVASLLGYPQAALMYSIFPGGLVQSPVVQAVLPASLVILVAFGLLVISVVRRRSSPWCV